MLVTVVFLCAWFVIGYLQTFGSSFLGYYPDHWAGDFDADYWALVLMICVPILVLMFTAKKAIDLSEGALLCLVGAVLLLYAIEVFEPFAPQVVTQCATLLCAALFVCGALCIIAMFIVASLRWRRADRRSSQVQPIPA